MELYKTEKINPFSGLFLILLQIPIIFALYFIFLRAGFPEVNTEILYSFVKIPEQINTVFLGFIDISQKSFLLALVAGITQFFQARLSSPNLPQQQNDKNERSLASDFAKSMSLQMRYVFPVIIFFIAWNISAAIALYLATSNIFMIGQELYVKKDVETEKNEKRRNN